jgi:archaellum component FlaC
VIPQFLHARSEDHLIPGSGLPFLSRLINQLEAQSPEDYMNESLSSGSDYSDYERDYEDEDRLDPLRGSIDQEIDFIEMVFDNLREELHTYSNKAAIDTIKKTMKDVNIEITELMQDIEPPCDNIQIVIRRVAEIKRNIDRLSEVLRAAEESSN